MRLVFVAALGAALLGACGQGEGAAGDEVVLTVPACDDDVSENACADAYTLDGVTYLPDGRPTSEGVVLEAEVNRHPVADPRSIDEVVTTDEPDVIYLRFGEEWYEARTVDGWAAK